MKGSFSGKNYNYAHDGLRESWSSGAKELSKLAEMRETGLTETLGKFEFTCSCLERLVNVITQLEEIDGSREFNRDEAMSRSEMQWKMTCFVLERIRYDFGWIYGDVKSNLTQICHKNEIGEFEKLLSESSWMVGALAEIGKELSIEALSKKNFKMFDLIASKDPNFSQHRIEILKTVLSKKDLDAAQFLLSKCSPEDISNVLGSKEYYGSSREVIEEITKFCSNELSAKKYKAMFLYSKGEYGDAVGLFDEVIKGGAGREKQIAQYYKGLCLQYSGGSKEEVTRAFKSVMESDIDGYYDKTSSIKQHAEKRLDSLKGEEPVKKLAAKWKGGGLLILI